jgi:hypothetical protein
MGLEGWSAPALAQLEGGGLRPGFLLRVASTPVIRLWAGVGDLAIDSDAVETQDGAIYAGSGALVGVPAISALVNGVAERADFTLSGTAITGPLASLAGSEAELVRGAAVNLGFLVFDDNGQKLSPVAWLWDGEADVLRVARSGQDGQAVRSLTLSVGSIMTGRRRPGLAYFTDADQRRRSADDAFFDRVKIYSRGSTRVWPT